MRRDEEAVSVAAAASAEPVSPELALVDAALATKLRAILVVGDPLIATTAVARPAREEPAVERVEVPPVAPAMEIDAHDPIADLIVGGPGSRVAEPPTLVVEPPTLVVEPAVEVPAHDPSADPIVEEADQPAERSWYPALPAPGDNGAEPMDATEAVLREIRDRLATPAPAKRRRRFRRRFTIASGLSTALALGVFAASVAFGVTQLPV
jgi:hypothetical protein